MNSVEAARRRTTRREILQKRYRIRNDRLLLLGQDIVTCKTGYTFTADTKVLLRRIDRDSCTFAQPYRTPLVYLNSASPRTKPLPFVLFTIPPERSKKYKQLIINSLRSSSQFRLLARQGDASSGAGCCGREEGGRGAKS